MKYSLLEAASVIPLQTRPCVFGLIIPNALLIARAGDHQLAAPAHALGIHSYEV